MGLGDKVEYHPQGMSDARVGMDVFQFSFKRAPFRRKTGPPSVVVDPGSEIFGSRARLMAA